MAENASAAADEGYVAAEQQPSAAVSLSDSHVASVSNRGSRHSHVVLPKPSQKEEPLTGAATCMFSKPAEPEAVGEDEGLLATLSVDPLVRLSRLKRSTSGLSFQQKYDLQEGKVLGTGMSGGVCLATTVDTGAEVAVKVLSTVLMTPKQRAQRLAEVKNQLTMDHPGICRLLEVYEEPTRLVLVMERLKGSDLFEHMVAKRKFSEQDAAGYVRQIASAVAYCHSRGVCHRDLKLDNFCLTNPDTTDACVKMIDFGLSADSTAPMTDSVGTLYYAAPEVLRRGEYDESCDMWSLGVLTFVMLCGRPPFEGNDDRETAQKIRSGVYNFRGRFSKNAADFIACLLQVDPSKRLKKDEVLSHPWLAETQPESAEGAASETPEVATEVLLALRAFMRSNALKRAVLCAVAPVATLDEVAQWEDSFKALDKQGRGTISVQALTEQLQSQLNASEIEALTSSFADADMKNTEISYSAFLAACLSTQTAQGTLSGAQLQEIFDSMDKDRDGLVSIEEIRGALGNTVDTDDVQADLKRDGPDAGKVSFHYFRWLVLSPTRGLQPLLQSLNGRIDTIRAKGVPGLTGNEAFEAARRENAAWRIFHRDRESPGLSPLPDPSDGPNDDQVSNASACNLVSNDTALDLVSNDTALLSTETAKMLGEVGTDLPTAWAIATAEAKDGEVDARRRENMAWRKMGQQQQRSSSTEDCGTSAPSTENLSLN